MKTYNEFLEETFSICKDKSVLELASFNNRHSRIIKGLASSWKGVEPDQSLEDEEFNISGNAFRDKDITTPIPFSFTISCHIVNKVLDSVGYKYVGGLENYNEIKDIDTDYGTSKKDCWLGIYEKS
mgnify:CR=1 FL=1